MAVLTGTMAEQATVTFAYDFIQDKVLYRIQIKDQFLTFDTEIDPAALGNFLKALLARTFGTTVRTGVEL